MSLYEFCIRRHVLAYMMSGVLLLFGYVSYQRIGLDRFPHIEFPMISISTTLPGANPDIIDASITNIIETSVNSIPGIEHITSSSSPGVSIVTVRFALEKDIDVAFNEIQSKINQSLRRLPEGTDPPVIGKVEVGAQPIMWLALTGDRTLQQLNQYAVNTIKKRLETIDGIGEVLIGGRRSRTIRIELDTQYMAGLGIAVDQVINALRKEHIQFPGGFLTSDQSERMIKLDLEFHSPQALKKLIVINRKNAPVRLEDIARIEDGLEDYRQVARFQGKPAVGIGLVKISNSNTVKIIDRVQEKLALEIRPQLPPGMALNIASNDATLIQDIVDALENHLLEGTLLAGLVVWLFLQSFRSTLIIATAIPVSLLGAIAAMYFLGFTFNTMTLLALLLLIGVVVDDAIVVLENIFRHRQKITPDPVDAAIQGTREVVFSVIAASLSLVCIFVPVIFMGGIIGRFFVSFAIVVTVGILVSLFVSLTLTPMLCSRYLNAEKKQGKFYNNLEHGLNLLDKTYTRLINLALARRWGVVIVATFVVLSSGYFFANIEKSFMPEEDDGQFIVSLRTPLGVSIHYTNERLQEIEAVLKSHPEISNYFTAIGLGRAGQVNKGIAFVRMVPLAQRDLKQQELLTILRKELADIAGVKAFPVPISMVGGQRGEPLQFILQGPELTQVGQLANSLQEKFNQTPELGYVDLSLQLNLPQLEIDLDRERAAALGISASDVALALNVIGGGTNVAKFNDEPGDGQRYDIRLKASEERMRSIEDLKQIYVKSQTGQLVRLDSVVDIKETLGPAVIDRYDLQYSAHFYSTPTVGLAQAVTAMKQVSADSLPLGYEIKLTGRAEEFSKTLSYIKFAFGMGLLLVYMILASQFNSFIQPLIIMVAQPLAIIGGVVALWLTNSGLNIYSMIGLVLLIGLVAKNSILLVDLTNQLRGKGLAIDEALRQACPIRLRPVLMTSITVILALLPAALGYGAGADTNGPLAVAVIGGMISSTLLTLVVVPAVYSLIENSLLKLKKRNPLQLSG